MTTRFYYWIVARGDDGRPYLISATMCKTEGECRQKGMEMLGGVDFEIKRYPTRDLSAASSMFRGRRLEEGLGLRRASQRQGHEKSLKFLRHRRSRRENITGRG